MSTETDMRNGEAVVTITRHPDTEAGAIAALGEMSSHRLKGATAKSDPWVADVWLVTHAAGRSIVYLARGDFEDVD